MYSIKLFYTFLPICKEFNLTYQYLSLIKGRNVKLLAIYLVSIPPKITSPLDSVPVVKKKENTLYAIFFLSNKLSITDGPSLLNSEFNPKPKIPLKGVSLNAFPIL